MSETKVQVVFAVSGNAAAELSKIDAEMAKIAANTKAAQDATARYETEIKAADAELAKLGQTGRLSGLATAQGMREAAGGVIAITAALAAATVVGAVANERQQQALTALGPAYEAVQRATEGTVTATEAWRVQQSLLQSGLPTTGRELAAITRAARDYARATGTETPAAIEQLSQALINGEAGGLRRFGLAVQNGATRTETFNSALRQLQTTQQASAPVTRSLAEETAVFGTRLTNAGSALAAFVSQAFDVPDALEAVSRSVQSLTATLVDFVAWRNEASQTLQQRAERSAALVSHQQSIQRLRANLQAIGEGGRSLAAAADIRGRSTEDIRALTSTMNVASIGINTSDSPEVMAGLRSRALASVAGLPAQVEAMRGAAASSPVTDTTAAARAAQIARERAATGGGAATTTGPSLHERQDAALQALIVRTRALAAEEHARGTAALALWTQIEEAGTAEKNLAVTRAQAAHDLVDVQRRAYTERLGLLRDSTSAEDALAAAQGRSGARERDRTAELTAMRSALQGLLAESTARIEAARAEHAPQEEMNALLRERIGIQQSLTQTTSQLAEVQRSNAAAMTAFSDAMQQQAWAVADAFGAATIAALESEQSFGAALASALREQVKSIAKLAVIEAIKNLAMGVGSLFLNPAASVAFFKASALWTGVAVLSGAVVANTSPSTPPSTPAKSASAGGTTANAASVGGAQQQGAASGPFMLNIVVNGAMFNEGVQESVVRALDGASARGIVPRRLTA